MVKKKNDIRIAKIASGTIFHIKQNSEERLKEISLYQYLVFKQLTYRYCPWVRKNNNKYWANGGLTSRTYCSLIFPGHFCHSYVTSCNDVVGI